jgi:hypothetical protein
MELADPRADRRALIVAVALALAATALQYALFLPHHHELWCDALHDRNAHYFFGVTLALDVRNADVVSFVQDVNSARVWPPLHGLLLGGVLTVGGFDPRLAVLPSLLAWAGLLVGVFVLARRVCPAHGNVAGFAAMLFTLASPTHRAFATDVMLESLGVCLSIWSLERYVALCQTPSASTGRWLGLVLFALFLTKFNYWVLVAAGLVATELVTRPGLYLGLARGGALVTARFAFRDPLVILALLSLGGAGALNALAPMQLGPVKITHGGDLATLAVVLLLTRVLLWRYRGAGRDTWPTLPAERRAFLAWGVLPVAVWFALPGRIAAFLWLGLVAHGEYPDYSLTSRAGKVFGWFLADYSPSLALLVIILLLALVAIVALPRLRPGAVVLLIFLLAATALTLKHPNSKSRFLINWLPALWVLAGVGLALLARFHVALRAGALALVAAICLPAAFSLGSAAEAGPHAGAPSLLPLADAYLPLVHPGERTAVLATVPMKFFTQWSYLQALRPARDMDLQGRGWLYLEVPSIDGFTAWLDRTRCETIILLDVAPGSPFGGVPPGWTGDTVLSQWRERQHQFTPTATRVFPELGATVVVFQRNPLARK